MRPGVSAYIDSLDILDMTEHRKNRLRAIAQGLSEVLGLCDYLPILSICTHNSRRSAFSQVWCEVLAHYYGLSQVQAFSGGTVRTAIYPQVAQILSICGLITEEHKLDDQYMHFVKYEEDRASIPLFSKKYDDPCNPNDQFVAIMNCDQAHEACPVVHGAIKRFVMTYADPKRSDGSVHEERTYQDTCHTIARDWKYIFHTISRMTHEQ